MQENQTLGGKDGETSQVVTPTTTTVPGGTTDTTITPAAGDTQTVTTPVDTTTVKPGGVDDQQPAPRSRAAERIGELIRNNKALQEELEKYRGDGEEDGSTTTTSGAITTVPAGQQQTISQDSPEFQRAKDFLKNLGFSPKDDVQGMVKEEIGNFEARLVLDTEKSRLEGKYSGEDGRPKYDHDRVMKHAVRTGIYNPEAAYENLYKAELIDWAIKQAQQAGTSVSLERPSSSTTGEPGLDRESLARILATPEGRKWYEENRDKVMSALQKGEL